MNLVFRFSRVCCLLSFWFFVVNNWALAQVKQPTLKVLSFNIHHGNPPDSATYIDLAAIAKVIATSQADLVALQEVDNNVPRSLQQNQASLLAERLGMQYHFFKAIDLRGGEYGVAILSKYPMEQAQSFSLPQVVKAEMRVLGEVLVTIAGQKIIFANTHLDAERSDENRDAQMSFITDRYRNSKLPIIFCGDLNSNPNKKAIAMLDEVFKRTCIADCLPTFPQKNPRTTIDYIATKNLKAKLVKLEVIDEQYASDHRPILAEFQLER